MQKRDDAARPGPSPATAAMIRALFSPLVRDGRVDERLLSALGIVGEDYSGHFDKALDPDEATRFDFYMEARAGRRIFFDVKLREDGFATCADDDAQKEKIERVYRPQLHGYVDDKWLAPAAFCAHCEVLGKVSYLGRYADSGIVFIFPRTSDPLMEAGKAIKQIVSKTLAPRTAILYLEYVVERILAAVSGDEAMREHYLEFREQYIGVPRGV